MKTLNSQTLHGLWSAVPTPWARGAALDGGVLARNCEKLRTAQVDGIYTTDSDGEFYAIELPQFRELARNFGRLARDLGFDAAMGVTWTHTAGIIDRMKASCDAGIACVHVAFPFFMPLARPDVDRFWDDLATAVPAARWVHYAHPKCGPALSGSDYARLSESFPEQLIGTKLATDSTNELTEIISRSPGLAHFATDRILLPATLLGARGCYSYWVNTLPAWHRRFFDACRLPDRRAEAVACHAKFLEWEHLHVAPLRSLGHNHGVLGKARAALSGWLEDSGETRPPYYPIAEDLRRKLVSAFRGFWAHELPEESFSSPHGYEHLNSLAR